MRPSKTHLLIPKEHKIFCTKKKPSDKAKFTSLPSKCDCAVCLTRFRRTTGGKGARFNARHATVNRDFRTVVCETCGCPACICD